MSPICTCGLLKVRKVGTSIVGGHEVCNKCGLPLEHSPAWHSPALVDEDRVTTLQMLPGHRITSLHGVVTELTATSGWTATSKGNSALKNAMKALRTTAGALSANAIVGLSATTFAAGGGITTVFGGDAVGVLLVGTAVTVEEETPVPPQLVRDS